MSSKNVVEIDISLENGKKQLLQLKTDPKVYEPREDSELLAQAAAQFAFGNALDLGCGTGIGGIAAATNSNVTKITFADINPSAVELARQNAKKNKVKKAVSWCVTDLFSNLSGKFDTILFNPPYLPTEKAEKLEGNLNTAFDGGKDGRKVLNRFLKEFEKQLTANGILLLLNSSLSEKDALSGNKTTQKSLEKKGFSAETVTSQRFFFEELVVFKAQRFREE